MPNPRLQLNVRLEQALIDGLKAVQERDGVPQSEQVRRALKAWLDAKGVLAPPATATKTARKRAATRKRA